MIACAARTGSTMLVRTLRSHPRLIVHGEVWGDRMVGVDGPLGRACDADPACRDALERVRFERPAEAMAQWDGADCSLAAEGAACLNSQET